MRPGYEGRKCDCVGIIAKRLSVRLLIMQVWRALVGSLSEVVFVCLSVCLSACLSVCMSVYNRFKIKGTSGVLV